MTESYSLTPGQEASAEWDWDRQLGKYTASFFSLWRVTAGGRVIYIVKLKDTDLFYVGVLLFHKSTWVAITCDGLLHFIVKASFSTLVNSYWKLTLYTRTETRGK